MAEMEEDKIKLRSEENKQALKRLIHAVEKEEAERGRRDQPALLSDVCLKGLKNLRSELSSLTLPRTENILPSGGSVSVSEYRLMDGESRKMKRFTVAEVKLTSGCSVELRERAGSGDSSTDYFVTEGDSVKTPLHSSSEPDFNLSEEKGKFSVEPLRRGNLD